ncbi:hypothetical protein DNL40_13200 [Xylanimonas oleitrophica]|uniref:Phosphodiesterase n=1 Tax=Xylanimonas oleitrophica TaxID=2607479 RepID=A0A2W5XRA2_9MICO|nr:hypothetical protein [Xylanimonas oleitrophica]PZR52158.1 hypothetical protein DNL40_13200 [Xylanimonas oleitrophica]
MPSLPLRALARSAGLVLAGAVGAAAAVLRTRPLHPDGVVLDGVLVVDGPHGGAAEDGAAVAGDGAAAARGAAVVAALPAGRTPVVVRLSLGAGMPRTWPDVAGIAIRWHAGGLSQDLLLGSARPGPLGRFVPTPRRRVLGWFSTVMPLRTEAGPVLLGLHPAAVQPPGHVALDLVQAAPRGPWQRVGALELLGPAGTAPHDEEHLRFDPTANAPRGLGTYRWEDALRAPSYAAARRWSGAAGTAGPSDRR